MRNPRNVRRAELFAVSLQRGLRAKNGCRGDNRRPNSVELALQALGSCYAVGYVANAAAQGIELARVDYEVEGDIDVSTFLGLDGPRAVSARSG